MTHRGVRELKTYGGMADGRRARTVHGAYIELAALALQRQRLIRERRTAVSRAQEIETRMSEMDHQATVLLKYIEKPDPAILAALAGSPRAACTWPGPALENHAIRQKALTY